MAPSRRKLLATEQETLTPPDHLPQGHSIARVIRPIGSNLYSVQLPQQQQQQQQHNSTVLVELPPRFRSTIWIKRGSYVLVDTNAVQDRENKGEIINVVRDEKSWRRTEYW